MLIVEDGTCPDGANSYASVEQADIYFASRPSIWPSPPKPDMEGSGETQPAVSPVSKDPNYSLKEDSLSEAALFLNTLDWVGEKLDWTRLMAWPRLGVKIPSRQKQPRITGGEILPIDEIPVDMVPPQVSACCMELAGLIITYKERLLAPLEHGGKITSLSTSTGSGVDVLNETESKSVTYADNAPVETFYPIVAGLLAPFLKTIPGKKSTFLTVNVSRG